MSKSIITTRVEIPFCFDLLFKKNFGDIHNLKPLKTLLKESLNIVTNEIKLLNSELIGRPYKDKNTAVDLIVSVDNHIKVNIEVNTSVKQELINRNIYLVCINMSKDLEYGEPYNEINNQIQLNFDLEGHHDEPISTYYIMEEKTHKPLTDKIKIVRYDVPFFFNKCYNEDKNKLSRLDRLIGLFGARTLEEVKYICEGDEELEEILRQYEKNTNDSDVIGAYDYEFHQKEIARIDKKYAVEEAIEETTKEVTERVTEEVSKQSKIEIAKNMLKLGLDMETIAKATELDIQTIKELQ